MDRLKWNTPETNVTITDEMAEKASTLNFIANWSNEGDTTWQRDFIYTLDDTANTIICTRYINNQAESVTVPASAVINGKTYSTVLSYGYCGVFQNKSTDKDQLNLNSITIEKGVKNR